MCAYISFIILCVVLRIIIDFPLWNSIVFAITVSSFFFAGGDFCLSLSQTIRNSIDSVEKYIEKSDKITERFLTVFAKLDGLEEMYEGTGADISDLQSLLKSKKEEQQKSDRLMHDIKETLFKTKKDQERYRKIANVFIFLGYFFLLSPMCITSFVTIPLIAQEILTVSTFAIILITQQFNNYEADRVEKKIIANKKDLETYEEAWEKLFDYYYTNLRKDTEQKMEETNHAN